nr:MAG TPA: helix-turn-helix domain-containing protein [Caudoviricetes sp.]
MAKAVLISIRPEWVEKILSGKKTLEVRKNRPVLETPFKCYIYCTLDGLKHPFGIAYGRVVGEFVCDRISPIVPATEPYGIYDVDDDFVKQTGLVNGALWDYGKGVTLYGWHISKLEIYDMPKELNEFWFPPEFYCEKERCGGCPYDQVADVNGEYSFDCEWKRPLTRPPQSWCYVEAME